MRCAIVSVVLGESFRQIAGVTYPTISAYARKIGAEQITISEQKVSTHPHYEKLILGELLNTYDRAILLDIDLIIRPDCPNLFELVPEDQLGMYDEGLLTTDEEKQAHRKTMEIASQQHGKEFIWDGHFWNTGVVVASRCHKGLFAPPKQETTFNYWDQSYVNLNIQTARPKMHDIGYKFNRMYYVDSKVKEHRLESYIIHYAGIQGVIPIAQLDLSAWEISARCPTLLRW